MLAKERKDFKSQKDMLVIHNELACIQYPSTSQHTLTFLHSFDSCIRHGELKRMMKSIYHCNNLIHFSLYLLILEKKSSKW